jgi:phosphoribosylanthranilate isomerase
MTIRVKICGVKDEAALYAAVEGRADLVGFVFYPPSPRHLTRAQAAPLADYIRGVAASVALVVDADDALLHEIASVVNPDMFQLHGSETPERVSEVRSCYGKPVMKAIKVATAADAAAALAYRGAADLILFDARPAPGAVLPGGNGVPFDWRALEAVKDQVPFALSGGLTPENVGEAIRLTGARIVDVSSGVETHPGEKSPELIRRFLHAAKAAKQAA